MNNPGLALSGEQGQPGPAFGEADPGIPRHSCDLLLLAGQHNLASLPGNFGCPSQAGGCLDEGPNFIHL